MQLTTFNQASHAEAMDTALVWASIPTWAEAIADARPFVSVDDAARAATAASDSWGEAELEAALAHHPRIGQKPAGTGAEAAASRREQAAMGTAADEITAAIAAANADYEFRFGRIFLIRAAGRTPEEMLAEARRRLHNSDASETAEALAQLREIALLRLREELSE